MVFVGFSTPKRWNPLSWAIRLATGSKVSHAWLLVDDPLFGLRLVLEAHSTGFRLVTLERFARENRIVSILVPPREHPLDAGLPRAGGWLGEKFDAIGLVGMAWVLLRRILRLAPGRNPFRSARALFCSEAVVKTLKAAGYPGAERLGDEDTTPAEVRDFLLASGACEIPAARLNVRRAAGPTEGPSAPVEATAPPPADERAA